MAASAQARWCGEVSRRWAYTGVSWGEGDLWRAFREFARVEMVKFQVLSLGRAI